ncbi:trypsin-like peptidase domain-containing protein [Streptomyces sp. 5-8]|uniref:Trypsin-like peptidase domain-containing protein n=1 Tax=Streptomyces musisoli TaxID=2802280 RepID=A0ABS1PCF9_9ACTN|nr:trypsin-like peptidase domain-containing protein [Streptomyces musisoli]MBL1110059.1 trypsin-like peptidase domain-containing protein [Streptomyces musisoli]
MNEGNRVPPVEEPEGAADATPAGRTESADRPVSTGGAVPDATGADGDFELAKPVPAPPPATDGETAEGAGERAVAVSGTAVAAGETAVPSVAERPEPLAAGPEPDAERSGLVAERSEPAGETAVAASGERPKPLHDPDPYSTPPYGEPGPWAPAPPVQHPVAASAPGTAVPPPAVPPAPLPTPAPAPHVPGPASAPAPHVPGPASVPAAAVPGGAAPAPTTAVLPGAVPASVPAASVPPAAVPAASVPPVAGSVPQGGDAWGRYDPWAGGSPTQQALARGPLQQTGEAVLTDGRRNRRARRLAVVWTLLVALVSAGIGGAVGAYVERDGLGADIRLPQAGSVPAGRTPDSVAGIAARALPSVVTLHVRGADEAGTGTGFVLDAQGHILTNNHVVEPAGTDGEISVTFSSGDTVKAKVVGRDSGYDLAVVQVHGVRGLTPLPLGNSDDVRVGDPVVAIGAPFDLANTVTSGIISAKERPITAGGGKSDGSDVSYVDALQTDAPINPGNSGGPLLDSRAQVIGINSAIRSAGSGSDSSGGGQAGSIGLGFAIPVNQAKRVAEELINDGRATHPVIGVTLDMGYTGDGARIDAKSASGGPAVNRGGPGERAGLKPGDVVTGVGGERVHTGEELIVKIRAHRPGDRLRLTVERGGTEREISLVLGASEQN